MARISLKIIVALLSFVIGVTAVAVWTLRRQSPPVAVQILAVTATEPTHDAPPEAFGYLRAIEVINHNEDNPLTDTQTRFEDMSSETISIDLEPGESIENQIIVLHANPNLSAEFRLEQRFETSMSFSDEGPHLDLLDWKHYRSE